MNWSERVTELVLKTGLSSMDKYLDRAVINYLNTYDRYLSGDPYGMLDNYFLTEGPKILESQDLRSKLIDALDDKEILELAKCMQINPNLKLRDEIVKNWDWLSLRTKEFCKYFGISEAIEEYKSLLSDVGLKKYPDKAIESAISKGYFELHSFQAQIQERIIDKILVDKETKILLRLPTGGGKTRTSIHTVIKLLNTKKEDGIVLWISYMPLLLDQALDNFAAIWPILGKGEIQIVKMYGDYNDPLKYEGKTIVFANVLQIRKYARDKKFSSVIKLIVFDEVHQLKANEAFKFITQLYFNNPSIILLGLTATPGRGDLSNIETKQLNEYFDVKLEIDVPASRTKYGNLDQIEKSECERTAIVFLQEKGVLAKLVEKTIKYKSLKKYKNIEDDPIRNKAIVDAAIKCLMENKKVLIFANSVRHAKIIAYLLRLSDIKNGLILSENRKLREKVIEEFRNSKSLNILVNYDVLTTGFDAPEINAIIVSRNTGSLVLYSQILGRALRGPRNNGHEYNYVFKMDDRNYGNVNDVYKSFGDYFIREN